MSDKRLFCFGLGFSARALATRLREQGFAIAGTCRSEEKCSALAAEGIETFLFNGSAPLGDVAAALDGTTHLLVSAPPGPDGDPVLRHHAEDIAALAGTLDWVGYLSTTGVYGDRDGDWVDETSALEPTGTRGQRRVDAERAWLALVERGVPAHTFRLAGIYGPQRNQLASLRNGTARRIDKPGQVFSRIHVDDIVAVLEASIARPNPGTAYNVCDDEAAPPEEVVRFAAELIGVQPPPLVPFDKAELSDMARSFYRDNKRVKNDRIKRELGIKLRYSTYRDGLRALAEDN